MFNKKSLEVNIKQAVDDVKRIQIELVVRYVWTWDPLVRFLESEARPSGTFTFTTRVFYQICSAASLECSCNCSEKKEKKTQQHFPFYKVHYIML